MCISSEVGQIKTCKKKTMFIWNILHGNVGLIRLVSQVGFCAGNLSCCAVKGLTSCCSFWSILKTVP